MQTVISIKKNQEINCFVLSNGITLMAIENQAADLISAKFFLKKAGSRWEKAQQAGLSHLVSAVLPKGTANLTSLEIAEKIESIGASLGADASTDYFMMSMKTVTADFAQVLELVAEIMRSPSFPDQEIELEKRLTIQNIRSQQESPFNVAFNQLREAMYPHHPYGFSMLGTEETVSSLTATDLKEYHQTFFRPDNLVISLSGRIQPDVALDLIEKRFGDWQAPNISMPSLELSSLNPQPLTKITPQETQQSIIMLGYLCPGVKSSDYPVIKLITSYLGNGLSSRLFVELREKRGLAYDVSAVYPTRLDTSQFVVYMGTAPENTAIALEGMSQEVERLSETLLSQEELKGAKNKLLGQYALGKQTNGEIAQVFGWYETLGMGIEFDSEYQQKVAEVTPEMIQEVASKYLQNPYISLVGPEAYCQI